MLSPINVFGIERLNMSIVQLVYFKYTISQNTYKKELLNVITCVTYALFDQLRNDSSIINWKKFDQISFNQIFIKF